MALARRRSRSAGLKNIIDAFNREGLTTVKDPGVSGGRWNQYRQLLEANALNVRVFALWRGGRTLASVQQAIGQMSNYPKLPASLGDGRLISGGVKLYIDGSGGARTGWMHQPWNLESSGADGTNVGYPTTEPELCSSSRSARCTRRASTSARMPLATKAWTGSWTRTPRRSPRSPREGLRHSIIHANLPTDHAIEVMARLQKHLRRGLPGAAAAVSLVDRRHLRRQLRPDAIAATAAAAHDAAEGRASGRAAPTTP